MTVTASRLAACFAALALAGCAVGTGGSDRHVAVLSIDGLGASELLSGGACLGEVATLRTLARQGAHSRGVRGVLPTVTYPTHATMVTGADPVTHGVIDNGARGVWWLKSRSDIKADTLWDAAKRSGKTTAIVTWPSTFGADATYLIPEDLAPRTVATDDIRKGSTPGLFDALAASVGEPALLHFGHPESGTPLDRMTATFAAEIVRRHRPNLLLAHFLDYDHRMHAAPFSPDACRALGRIDAWVAHIVDAYEQAGIRDRTTFFIVSDHGFLKVEKSLGVIGLLREAGLDTLLQGEAIEKAFDFRIAGGSIAFYPVLERSAEWTERVRAHLRPRLEAAHGEQLRWITPDDARSMGGFPDAAFILCARRGFSFRMLPANSPGVFTDPGRFVGAHGYCPDESAMDAAFIASGHGVRAAGDIGALQMKDLGPTIAPFLDAKLKDATGMDQSGRFR